MMLTARREVGCDERPAFVPVQRRFAFKLDRHDLRSVLPQQLQMVLQNGFLEQTFRQALYPEFLFPAVADSDPWEGGLGAVRTSTRKGLLSPVTTPITGSDTSIATYGKEQWSVRMDQYGNSVQTNLLTSEVALASLYLADVQQLGINAGQSLNQIARNRLYSAYAGGRTWLTAAAASGATSVAVSELSGFATVLVAGEVTPVSASAPLAITVDGQSASVIGASAMSGPGTLTLAAGLGAAAAVSKAVVASNAPVSIRSAGSSAADLTAVNTVTASMFRSAVARLRKMNVPTVMGHYVAHVDPDTEAQLFADSDFKQAYQGRGDSPVFQDLSIGRFLGIDWVRNIEAPTVTNPAGVTVHRPIVTGGGVLVNAPLRGQGQLLDETGMARVPNIAMVNVAPGADVVMIVKPAQDNLQQVINTTWAWTGDFGVPTDSLTGDGATFKRAVVLEHA